MTELDHQLQSLQRAMRAVCPPAVWRAGEQLSGGSVTGETAEEDEIELQVVPRRGGIARNVSLYPLDDEWSCDCPAKGAVCEHAVAAVLATRASLAEGTALPTADKTLGQVSYRFTTTDEGLCFDRVAVWDGGVEPIRVSLAQAVGGRVKAPPVNITAQDLEVERRLGAQIGGRLGRDQVADVLKVMESCRDVRLDGEPVRTSRRPVLPRVCVEGDDEGGFTLTMIPDPDMDTHYRNGIARCGELLRPLGEAGLPRELVRRLLRGHRYGPSEVAGLVTRVLPEIEARLQVEVRSGQLPGVSAARPRVVVDTAPRDGQLQVTASIVYGDPVVAHVEGDAFVVTGARVPTRDEDTESRLAEALRRELGLVPDVAALLDGEEAVAFAGRLRAWEGGAVRGEAHHGYTLAPPLRASVRVQGDRLNVGFSSTAGSADPSAVFAAWRRGSSLAPLDDGGWSPIPADWLRSHGALVSDLLACRDAEGDLPRSAMPDLARLCEALGEPPPPSFEGLSALVEGFEGLPVSDLPPDLTATLRSYQRAGVDWLAFMASAGLGALLADDMGLGKTLQALTVVRGRTLVVAPTSVLRNWVREAETFRPGLRVCTYHGPNRRLDPEATLVVTSYALLRLDVEALTSECWDLVILDEAQAIKNADSQVAQAAYRLQARARVTLTGTPVENRLSELWSQMRFLNPGLLGDRRHFDARYERPIAQGLAGAASDLRERLRPFVLRRLKRDVAPELPPRTEVVRHVALSEAERQVYDSIRAATQAEIVSRLQEGGSPLKALAALMRLRQAACHRALVPGQAAAAAEPSSKVLRLVELIDALAAGGHKALVFSQWTSLLDLLEPHLTHAELPFVRLDGATRDRQGVVDSFQAADGPPVMLISLKAGGTGLNLTAADHVFLLDPWWNPAVEDQAADRAHRIGQDKPVMVHRLVALDTVEERILQLQASKRALADAALGDADQATGLTREDLMGLLR